MKKLKKKLLFPVLMIACFANSANLSAIGAGIYGGYNHANLIYNDDATNLIESTEGSASAASANYLIGAYAYVGLIPDFGIPFIPTLAFQLGIAYAKKGGELERQNANIPELNNAVFTVTLTFSNSYVEFPILLKPRISLFVIDLYALGGVSLALQRTALITAHFTGGGSTFGESADLFEIQKSNKEDTLINSFNLNYVVGGGLSYEFLVLFEAFLEVRYSSGLLDIVPSDIPNSAMEILGLHKGARHQDIYIIAGIGLKI